VKAVARSVRENTLEGRIPGEPRARAGLTHRREVADSRVEQSPEVEGRWEAWPTWGLATLARRFGARDGKPKPREMWNDALTPGGQRRRRRRTAAREEQSSEGRTP
jgi:hypothetical protein